MCKKDFCSDCGCNDSDLGCSCPENDEVYQSSLYIYHFYDFNRYFDEWLKQKSENGGFLNGRDEIKS